MPDWEKVLKGLESLRDICNAKADMAVGKGKIAWAGYANAAADALELLKEQRPVAPHLVVNQYEHILSCSNCGTWFQAQLQKYKYCPKCGSKVKWE